MNIPISICYVPENPVAEPFLTSFGFTEVEVEVGRDHDGEVIVVLKL